MRSWVRMGVGRTSANKQRKSEMNVSAPDPPTENRALMVKNPAKSDFISYLLSGPKVDEFEVEPDRDTGREIEL